MDLEHTFEVPVGVEAAWQAFLDVGSVAECFPGAAVTSVEGDTFEGTCKVKLGPVSLLYAGSGSFVEKDGDAHHLVLEAKGKDKRGNGTAGAKVSASFAEVGPSTTRVEVLTDLQITGKPAQFGRGVMQEVSDKLLGQFVDCLQQRFVAPEPEPEPEPEAGQESGQESGAPAAEATRAAPPPRHVAPPAQGAEAIDLGATVLPVLLKSYGKQIAAGLVVLFLLRWLFRRTTRA